MSTTDSTAGLDRPVLAEKSPNVRPLTKRPVQHIKRPVQKFVSTARPFLIRPTYKVSVARPRRRISPWKDLPGDGIFQPLPPTTSQLSSLDSLYREIRRQKIKAFELQQQQSARLVSLSFADMSDAAYRLNQLDSLPEEFTGTELKPRRILIQRAIGRSRGLEDLKVLLGPLDDAKISSKLEDIHLNMKDADIESLTELVYQYLRDGASPAAWKSDVYQEYFLKMSKIVGFSVVRLRKQRFVCHGPEQNTCPPAVQISTSPLDRARKQKSNSSIDRLAQPKWKTSKSPSFVTLGSASFAARDLPLSELNPVFCSPVFQPDYSYTTRPSQNNGGLQPELLPGFSAAVFGKTCYNPAYLYVKIHTKIEEAQQVQEESAFIAACALHDRLLLRKLTRDMQPTGECIHWDKALTIYVLICFAETCKIYVMEVGDGWSSQSRLQYTMTRVDVVDLGTKKGVKHFQDWLNHIHYFGTNIHGPTAFADANKAHNHVIEDLTAWKTQRVDFYYGPHQNEITTTKPEPATKPKPSTRPEPSTTPAEGPVAGSQASF